MRQMGRNPRTSWGKIAEQRCARALEIYCSAVAAFGRAMLIYRRRSAGQAPPLAAELSRAALDARQVRSALRLMNSRGSTARRTRSTREVAGSSLTPREREVAVLIARGLTNTQIAEALVITRGTAANHVAHILGRLGLRSRTQVAIWAVHNGLVQPAPEIVAADDVNKVWVA
jgi:DNA-binding CsgD family transcriptional regulator